MKKAVDRGRPIAVDPSAVSASRTLPVFLARPKNAPFRMFPSVPN